MSQQFKNPPEVREKRALDQALRRRAVRQIKAASAISLKQFIVYGYELDLLIQHGMLSEPERKNAASVEGAIRELIEHLKSRRL